jgi:hypothetical protein
MNSSLRIILSLALQLSAASAFIACGGDEGGDDDKTTTDPDNVGAGAGELKIAFNPMYSAFEPEHDYKVPAIVEGVAADQIKSWTASDPSAVSFTPTAEGTMITVRKAAGEVKITAESNDGKKGNATLKITEGSAALYSLGQTRYTTGGSAIGRTDAGFGPNQLAQCSFCHGETGALEVAHTPQQAGGYSDDELIKIFTEATKPAGIGMRTTFPEMQWKMIHKWQMNDDEKKGMVIYLRSLTPQPTNSELDFGRAIRRAIGDASFPRFDGGFRTPRSDAGGGGGQNRPDAGAAGGSTTLPNNLDAGL